MHTNLEARDRVYQAEAMAFGDFVATSHETASISNEMGVALEAGTSPRKNRRAQKA